MYYLLVNPDLTECGSLTDRGRTRDRSGSTQLSGRILLAILINSSELGLNFVDVAQDLQRGTGRAGMVVEQ